MYRYIASKRQCISLCYVYYVLRVSSIRKTDKMEFFCLYPIVRLSICLMAKRLMHCSKYRFTLLLYVTTWWDIHACDVEFGDKRNRYVNTFPWVTKPFNIELIIESCTTLLQVKRNIIYIDKIWEYGSNFEVSSIHLYIDVSANSNYPWFVERFNKECGNTMVWSRICSGNIGMTKHVMHHLKY